MKRTSAEVDLALYHAMFKDVTLWRPDLRKQLDRDYSRLSELESSQLTTFVMIDLVDTGKIVDKGLSRGFIDARDLPATLGRVIGRGSRAFLQGLFSLVFELSSGRLIDDVDPNSIFFLRQVLYLSKKVRKDCSDAAILKEVRDFSVIDRNLRVPTLSWDSGSSLGTFPGRMRFTDGYRRSPDLVSNREECPRVLLSTLDRVCERLLSRFPLFDWRTIRPAHGPGAVADARSGGDKYLFPTWPDKLESVFPHSYFARSREDLDIEEPMKCDNREYPARLIAVPKTLKGPRMIASEPTAHQFIQHGLMRWMRENLPRPLRACIAFQSQLPSQEACRSASRDGLQATVDLSSASDRLSCWVVERAFQYNEGFLSALWASRTRTCRVAVRNSNGKPIGDEELLLLRKFAPMGSGVTFPVQSVIYAAAAIAAVIYDTGSSSRVTDRSIWSAANRVRVFGDDIVLPSSSVWFLALLLEYLELKVNASKTHWQGHFRESCGVDAFRGYDVTPVYISAFDPGSTGEDLASWVDVSNNVHSAGLWCLAEAMDAKLPDAQRRLIPVLSRKWSTPGLSHVTFSSSSQSEGMVRSRTRRNKNLQRKEIMAFVLKAKSAWMEREGYQNLLQYFVEDPSPLTYWKAGWTGRQRLRLSKQWVPLYNVS